MRCEWLPLAYPNISSNIPNIQVKYNDRRVESVFERTKLNVIPAGRDSTAATLTFVAYFLAIHPKILLRVRQEILDKVGPSRRPDYDDIKDMKYLRAVINGVYMQSF
jgi:hypothetical protein